MCGMLAEEQRGGPEVRLNNNSVGEHGSS
jgi:hypothetical protein